MTHGLILDKLRRGAQQRARSSDSVVRGRGRTAVRPATPEATTGCEAILIDDAGGVAERGEDLWHPSGVHIHIAPIPVVSRFARHHRLPSGTPPALDEKAKRQGLTAVRPDTRRGQSERRGAARAAMSAWLLLPFLLVPPARADEITIAPLRIERQIASCEKHVYRLRLGERQTIRGQVEKDGVVVKLSGVRKPDDVPALTTVEVDTEWGGHQRFVILTEKAAEYELTIEAIGLIKGPYVLDLQTPRPTTVDDLLEVTAEHLMATVQANKAYQYDPALRPLLSQALAACRSAGAPECEASVLHLLAYDHWFSSNDVAAARRYLLDSLALREKGGDHYKTGLVLNDLGVVSGAMGELVEARAYYERAIPLRALTNIETDPLLLHNMAAVVWPLGDLQNAVDLEKKALELWKRLGNEGSTAYAQSLLGHFTLQLGDLAESERYQRDALGGWTRAGHDSGVAQATQRLGLVLEAKGDRRRALEHYRQALSMSEREGDVLSQGRVLVRIGALLLALREREEARKSFEKALQIFQKGQLDETEAAKGLGDVHAAAGDDATALDWYRRVLALTEERTDAQPRTDALLGMARVERDRGRLDDALAALEQATSTIETLRLRLMNPDVRASYLASRQALYDLTIDVMMRASRKNGDKALAAQAFEVSERARARGLLDSLAFAHVRQSRSDPELAAQEETIRDRVSGKATRLARMTPDQRKSAAGVALRGELERLISDHREIRDRLSRLQGGESGTILTVAQVQKTLGADTALLEYALGDSGSYLWVVTQKSIRSFRLAPRAEIESAARRLVELLPLSHRREVAAQARLAGQRLSAIVLAPAAGAIASKRLIIVADGVLQFVSFAALPQPGASSQPLIAEHEIVMLPSASVIATLRSAPRQQPERMVAVIADPVVGEDDPRLGGRGSGSGVSADLMRSVQSFEEPSFGRLLHTRAEAQKIASLTPASQSLRAVDFDASRALATGGELSKYRIVHFATHGLVNADQPDLSGLVLSLYDKEGRPQDGFLRLSDIYQLRLSADLVVLSACRTALGREVKREGLIGLTRGFMYAGAPRVVASLWDVRDSATAELMHRFYRHMLRDAMRPAAALRAAQLSMMREPRWSAPFYWAAFVLQGDWQ